MMYMQRMQQDQQLVIRISKRLLDTLDDLRRWETDVPSRAEMIRRLIERAGAEAELAIEMEDADVGTS
jgi:metal-responsive CopG/Arc/MetJ family transcriptional regulator